jgi:hypothetical protein
VQINSITPFAAGFLEGEKSMMIFIERVIRFAKTPEQVKEKK